jgi:hypothetical protein
LRVQGSGLRAQVIGFRVLFFRTSEGEGKRESKRARERERKSGKERKRSRRELIDYTTSVTTCVSSHPLGPFLVL